MNILLNNGVVIELKKIDFAAGQVDYYRTSGYTGDCMLNVQLSSLATAEADIKAALEAIYSSLTPGSLG